MVGMHRLLLELHDEDLQGLRQLARADRNRPVRDQGSWLLHLKIAEELAKLVAVQDDVEPVAEVA